MFDYQGGSSSRISGFQIWYEPGSLSFPLPPTLKYLKTISDLVTTYNFNWLNILLFYKYESKSIKES